ncbi:hypothetical protein T265_02392 [Opisthorchis viverrini]|uniref:Uncharacterized protein n=1 Tax=Opisthorchis viverrini TaxID=6198 RepID=A0A074ZV41_OPIVI|nr:hypothetical protein T265_02392 [Opisthorchis viverrini]KER31338.1 hypothetical protein T265_02392 [Opisthorchis viverrini]
MRVVGRTDCTKAISVSYVTDQTQRSSCGLPFRSALQKIRNPPTIVVPPNPYKDITRLEENAYYLCEFRQIPAC